MDGLRTESSAKCKKSGFLAPHLRIGKEGEEIAFKHLRSHGYKAHSRNVRVGRDEIDIIVYDKKEKLIVFVEVKTLKKYSIRYRPEFNFGFEKQEKFERAVENWVHGRGYEGGYRLDLVCVAGGKVVEHYRDITF